MSGKGHARQYPFAGKKGGDKFASVGMNKDRRINILHLRDSPWVDGPGRTILETGARIDDQRYGFLIGAFCKRTEPDHSFIKALTERGLAVIRINESHGFDATVLSQVRRLIKKERIDIVHTHEVRSDVIGLIAGKLTGIPVVTTLHGWIENGAKEKILTRFDKDILRFFDHVIAVSEKIKKEILGHGVCKEKVTVLHNALVLENYRRNHADRSFRRELGVGDETLLVASIGRLSPEKGQTDFIRAARRVLERRPDARFILVGVGGDRQKLESLSQSMGLNGKVLFLGYRSDMAAIYNSIDIVVQSSFTEGMPNVVLEALAMEVPVIATDVGGTAEAIKQGKTGVLVQPGRSEETAVNILKYIENKDHFKIMAKAGRGLVEREFGIDERTRKLSKLYDKLFEIGGKRCMPNKLH